MPTHHPPSLRRHNHWRGSPAPSMERGRHERPQAWLSRLWMALRATEAAPAAHQASHNKNRVAYPGICCMSGSLKLATFTKSMRRGMRQCESRYDGGGDDPALTSAAAVSSRPFFHSASSSSGAGVRSVYRPVSPGSARIDTSSKSITTSPLPDGRGHPTEAERHSPPRQGAPPRGENRGYAHHRKECLGG